jgi:radical SAM protein (TIGR01212 family)
MNDFNSMPSYPNGARYRKLGPTWIERFGTRVRKVTLRGGFGCPNRDGRIGTQGCIFCSEESLLPSSGPIFGSIKEQLKIGIRIAQKQGYQKVIAYFQDQTATDADYETLKDLYNQAFLDPRVVGLAIGTRPDWIAEPIYDLLADLAQNKPVFLELGLQSASNRILEFINRGHTVEVFENAVNKAHQRGLEVISHVILDLPEERKRDRQKTATCLNKLKVEGVKIHNLHVLADTSLAKLFKQGKIKIRPLEQYAKITADFIQLLDPAMIIHRLTGEGPPELMLAPAWGRDKRKILAKIEERLKAENGWQGKYYSQTNQANKY